MNQASERQTKWFTPPVMFDALGLVCELDPCSPGPGHWVPAQKIYTKADDGLQSRWHGLVFMNPPFGSRNGHVPWLRRFLEHGNGIAIVRPYTSSAWFHQWAVSRACGPTVLRLFCHPMSVRSTAVQAVIDYAIDVDSPCPSVSRFSPASCIFRSWRPTSDSVTAAAVPSEQVRDHH
jgi:hypothetical protein